MTVSLILDAAIVLIAGLTIFFAVRHGFVRTVQSAVVFTLAVVVALVLRKPVAELLYRTSIPQAVENGVVSAVNGLLDPSRKEAEAGTESSVPPEESAGDGEKDEIPFLQNALAAIGVDADQYRELLREKANGTADSFRNLLSETVVPKVVSVVIQVISVVGLFLVSALLLHLIFLIIRRLVDSVGFLRAANRFLGLAVGILLAAFRVFLFAAAVGALLNVSAISSLPVFSSFRLEDTYLFRWVQAINPLNGFFS